MAATNLKWGPVLTDGTPRTAVITGGNSGLGFECARQMALQGFKVIIACRSATKAEAAVTALVELTGRPELVEFRVLDVSSLASVDAFATAFLADKPRRSLHVLICNAGIMMGPQRRSADGFDLQLATNYLGHFHLVNLLTDRLVASAPARIINVASIAARFGKVHWDDVNLERTKEYKSMVAYQQSKLLQVIWSRELAHRLEGKNVTSNSLEPGIVKTSLSEGITDDPAMKRKLENGVSVEEGVKTHLKLAISDEVSGTSGEHWEKCKIISKGLSKFKYILAAHDLRASVGPKLWTFTEELIAPAVKAVKAVAAAPQ
jgi:NAD(P)-dependent dehydrogenase (short-subunit alcohol dehydrogenase family)